MSSSKQLREKLKEEFEIDQWQDIGSALIEYAHTEGYENPGQFSIDRFKEVTDWFIQKIEERDKERIKDIFDIKIDKDGSNYELAQLRYREKILSLFNN